MVMTRGGLADSMDPSFRKIFNDAAQSEEVVFNRIFDVMSSKQKSEKMSANSGLPLHTIKTEGSNSASVEYSQKDDKTFTHDSYACHTRVTWETAQDDLSGQIKRIPALQGLSARQTLETIHALVFDRSQTGAYTGADGKVLCATDHTRADGGTWSNRPSTNADISVSVLESGLSAMRATPDDQGNPGVIMPKILLLPNESEFSGIQLLENVDKAGTANRDINAIRKRGLQMIIWDFLTDEDSWYLLTNPSERQLITYMREKVNAQSKDAPDNTRDMIFSSFFRVSKGWVGARGIYGSIGI